MANLPRLQSFIGGSVLPHSGEALTLVDPFDGAARSELIEADAQTVATAVSDARRAFEIQRRSTLLQRSQLLRSAAAALAKEVDRFASLICEDVGKPIRIAQVEVRRGVEFFEACAMATLNIGGEVLPLDAVAPGAGHFGFTTRVPYGVVAAITPFNAPINLLVQKLAPAIAAGNTVVAKSAPSGTRASLALAELLCAAGWAPGIFNVVTGDRNAALAMVRDPGVSAVSFTGGTAAGESLSQAAGIKKFVAELGSNAANVILADADVSEAAIKIASAAFEASGQQCISAQRVLVDAKVYERFLAEFVTAARKLKVGPPSDPATDVGPMVHRGAADRVIRMCADAIKRGGRYALEPKQDGCTVSPGIIVDINSDASLWREEVFGPIAIVRPFADVEEALKLANDSPFGLQGSVFTSSLKWAMRFSAEFDVGALWVNEASRYRLDMYPFGGMKQSGTGREGVRYAIEELSQIKFTGMKL